jgi:hypothetical protein
MLYMLCVRALQVPCQVAAACAKATRDLSYVSLRESAAMALLTILCQAHKANLIAGSFGKDTAAPAVADGCCWA